VHYKLRSLLYTRKYILDGFPKDISLTRFRKGIVPELLKHYFKSNKAVLNLRSDKGTKIAQTDAYNTYSIRTLVCKYSRRQVAYTYILDCFERRSYFCFIFIAYLEPFIVGNLKIEMIYSQLYDKEKIVVVYMKLHTNFIHLSAIKKSGSNSFIAYFVA
jgi:hypothetical protein